MSRHEFLVATSICVQNINLVKFPYFGIKTSNYIKEIYQKNVLKMYEFLTHQIQRLRLGLRWTQAVPDVTSSFWRSISIFPAPPWGSVSVSLSPRTSVPLFLFLAFFLSRGRASPLRHKGLLAVDVLFIFGKHLGHACQTVPRDGEH